MTLENGLSMVELALRAAKAELAACEDLMDRYGLRLTASQQAALAARQQRALAQTGRILLEGGVLQRLVYAFCDSPFIQPEDWAETLGELIDTFYEYKNESGDALSDDELVEWMARLFDGPAQGSLDYLAGTSLWELMHPECGKD